MRRKVAASAEVAFQLKRNKQQWLEVYSFFPVDRGDCECRKAILEYQRKLALSREADREALVLEKKYLICPKDKKGMKRFLIRCGSCRAIQGYCWATDATLKDWCDFHYYQYTDGVAWHGCLTPHVSPITEQLCLECACGQDTRDMRANQTLPPLLVERLEERNAVGREYNQRDSKFIVVPIPNNMLGL